MSNQKKKKRSGGKNAHRSPNTAAGANAGAPAANAAKPKSSLMAQAEAKANKMVGDRDKSKKSGGSSSTKKGGIIKYFKDLKSEIKKVTWPSRSKIVNNTGVVLAGMIICGILVWGIDSGFSALLKLATGV